MPQKLIQVGTGGRGESWCETILQSSIEAGRTEVVAAVDVDEAALKNAVDHLDLPEERRYTDAEEAFAAHEADWCTIVVPPAYHEDIVDLAVDHGVDMLSEKPIADSLEASVRIVDKVEDAGLKMGITMNHRFMRPRRTLHEELHSGAHGPLNYITCHFTRDQRGEEHSYRMESDHPLLVDASVHHLDFLNGFVDADPETVYAQTWNRSWDNHAGDTNALVQIEFQNGVQVAYEGAKTNAFGLYPWVNEYVRAECRDATLLLDNGRAEHPDGIKCFDYDPVTVHDGPWTGTPPEEGGRVLPWTDLPDMNPAALLVEQFLDWREGGPRMETHVASNLESMAIVFAAIESSRTGQPISVPELLKETRADTAT